MAQTPERFCTNCGTRNSAGQAFCSNCGTALDGGPTAPPPPFTGHPQTPPNYPASQQATPPSVPQYAQAQQPPVASYAQAPQQPQKKGSPIMEALGALGLLFFLRRSGLRLDGSRQRRSNGCGGCLTTLIILAIIAVPVYFIYRGPITNYVNQIRSGGGLNGGGSTGGGSNCTSHSPTATQLNETVTYASDTITILNAQQAQSFADDNSATCNGVLRLNIQEKIGATAPIYAYSSVVNLVMPNGNTIPLLSSLQSTSPDAGVSRTNWLDFSLPTNANVSQLTLRVGTDAEAQMNIPLKANVDLSKYQNKTISPNATLQYKSVNWTITSATLSWSAVGKQAGKGMRYVTVTLKVDNLSSNEFIAYWGDYIRLKSDTATSAPDSSTLGTSFAASSTGATGDVVFIMPDNATSFTLLLGNTSSGETQVPANFQFS